MGAATIPVIFLLGLRLYSRRTGLLAALLYALAPLPALHAHFLTVDVPATLFVTLALLSAANLRVIGSFREVALAGIWCGLATATKYTAAVCVVGPLCALALGAAQTSGPERNAALRTGALRAAALIGIMAAVFLVACPGPWLNWGAFWNGTYPGSGVRYELFEHARTGHGWLFVDTGPGWWYHLSVSLRYGLGLPLLLLSAAGCVYAARRRNPSDIVLLAFLVVAYSATSLSAVRFARYLIPLTPALCVLAARVAVEPYARRIASRIALASAAITVVACALTTGGLVRALTLKDPRDIAADYLAGHAGSHVVIAFAHTPWFYSPPLSPLWGSVRSESRKNASLAQPNIEFRMPDGEWDPRVLSPPPDFLVLSNIELLPEWKRLRLPAAVSFMSLIPPGGWQTVFKPSAVFGLSPDDPDVPQDILYVLPEITVYEWKGR